MWLLWNPITRLPDWKVKKWYKHIMETLKGTQWIWQCAGCFAVTDGDIVLRSTNSNFNKRRPCTLFSRLTLFQLQYLVMLTTINRRWQFDFITALFSEIKNINDNGMLMSVVTLSTDIHSSLGCVHTFWTIGLIDDLHFYWYILVLPSYPPHVWKHFPLTTFEPNCLSCPEMC